MRGYLTVIYHKLSMRLKIREIIWKSRKLSKISYINASLVLMKKKNHFHLLSRQHPILMYLSLSQFYVIYSKFIRICIHLSFAIEHLLMCKRTDSEQNCTILFEFMCSSLNCFNRSFSCRFYCRKNFRSALHFPRKTPQNQQIHEIQGQICQLKSTLEEDDLRAYVKIRSWISCLIGKYEIQI